MIFLLDVNALLALAYEPHVHYARVREWVSRLDTEHGSDHATLATCPITELGFVRVSSGKAGYSESVNTARGDLDDLKSSMGMLFIPDALPTCHLPAWVRKSQQTTDGYLLALAKSHNGCLATLDRYIPGSVFIPEETVPPLMVREPSYLGSSGGSRGIELR